LNELLLFFSRSELLDDINLNNSDFR